MRNFIIFFNGREGTSPLVRLLNNFEQVSIIHQVNNAGWEPFDSHNCGPMPLRSFERCLDIIFNKEPLDFKRLNQIYSRMAKRPLEEFKKDGVVGFKMRFNAPRDNFPFMRVFSPLTRLSRKMTNRLFRRMMFNVLKRNDVVVFLAVRQDVLKFSLSKYRGGGMGKTGHLQFKLASGNLDRHEIGTMHVDCTRLEKIISEYEESHARKRRLMEDLKLAGIQAHPLCYEDFLADKQQYFSRALDFLGLKISMEEIDTALNKGAYFEKVHSSIIADFVENHEEVEEKFGNRFISWS